MSDLIDRQAAIDEIKEIYEWHDNVTKERIIEHFKQLPPAQPKKGVIEQIKWERDVAIEQLKKLGYGLGEKIRAEKDCISRQAVKEMIKNHRSDFGTEKDYRTARACVNAVPPAQPEQPEPDQNGDLWITVPDIDDVTCIYVQESKSKFCRIFYEEKEQPERIVRCKDCKYWIPYDWMFSEVWRSKNMADYSEDEIGCNYCDMTMKANDFCSRAERKEVTE